MACKFLRKAPQSFRLGGEQGLSETPVCLKQGAPSSFLFLEARMLLVAMPGAPGSVLAPSSKARSP